MKESKRFLKRIRIGSVYVLFILAISGFIYFIFKPEPSCQDGILNQNEERIDCGGPCFPCTEQLEVVSLEPGKIEWTLDAGGGYDILGEIVNPNELVGLENFKFRFVFLDENEKIFYFSPWEENFILPKEKKVVFSLGLILEKEPKKIQLELDENSFLWKKFSQYIEPDLFIINPRFEQVSEIRKNQVVGTLINKSKVDFETIRVKVFIRDNSNKLLGINYQIINTVRANEQRDFVIFFPQIDSQLVADIKVEPETNVFSSENFIQIYGKPERWNE